MSVLLVPIKGSVVSNLNDAKSFAKIYIEDGKSRVEMLKEPNFEDIDFYITNKKDEDLSIIRENFITPLLVPREDMEIDDVIEAFLFKEFYKIEGENA